MEGGTFAAGPPGLHGGRCPRDASPLAQQRVGDVVLDYCPRCGGVFFDAGELEQLEGRSPRLHMAKKKRKDDSPLCVRCSAPMDPYRYSGTLEGVPGYPYGVEIDYCPECRSYWLDGGEFKALRAVLQKEETGHVKVDDVTAGQYLLMLLTSMPLEYNVATRRTPWITIGLVMLNVVVFLVGLALLLVGFGPEHVALSFGLIPAQLAPATLYMLLTYQIVHGGLVHVAGNMYFLYVFGDNLEDRWGRGLFLLVYVVIGAIAGLAHALLSNAPSIPLVGASGAISGLLGAYLVTFPRARVGCLLFFVPLRVSVLVYMLLWFGVQVLGVLAEAALGTSFPVSVSCHATGFVCGLLAGLLLRRRNIAAP